MIHRIASHFALVLSLALTACSNLPASAPGADPAPPVRNVIFMMSDGTPHEAWALTRWVTGKRLASDDILTGAVQTYGADSIITDSAPGASAFATGRKGSNKGIAVAPWRVTITGVSESAQPYAPLPTVIEGARLSGRATGLVATSNIQHASPAAFSAHTHDRGRYNDIGEQQVYQHLDVVLGGGEQHLLPMADGRGVRQDNEDLTEVLRAKGYTYVRTRAQLHATSGPKVFGMFAPDDMAFDLDRAHFAPDQPSLAEMTHRAIDLLSRSEKGRKQGFFLFVEASKVDWAAHGNDPSGVISDLAAYDAAVKVALDFARADGQTLIISTSDHGNGGLSIGRRDATQYASTDDDSLVAPLRRTQLTGEGLARLLALDKSEVRIKDTLKQHWGIQDVSAAEVQTIQSTPPQTWLQSVLGPMLSRRSGLGWTTGNHTGGDPFLYSYGPGRVIGLWDNAALGRHMAALMGLDLQALQARLFVDAIPELEAMGLRAAVDHAQMANPVLRVRNDQGEQVSLPIHKNQLHTADQLHELEGLVVLADQTGKVYIPRQAVALIKAKLMR